MKRSPVVVVVGHVDHGKTTLLDYIRKSNVASREVGGITQSIGAYEVAHAGERLTFIDTPGHEAFSKMRQRGANIADLAILVVAADDGVQNQTKEAIKILQETETPYVVAINKVDRVGDKLDNVKSELMQAGVLLEGFGGSVSYQPISAKDGKGVAELLDLLLLTADVEQLTYEPKNVASGYVLESKMDNRRGVVATVILKDGTLREGDEVRAGGATGKIKMLEDFAGKKVKELNPSSPARIFGFESLPKVGDEFRSAAHILEAEAAMPAVARRVAATAAPKNEKEVTLILKADVAGSLEALSGIMRGLPVMKGMNLTIIDESVGDITDGDIKDAIAHGGVIIGFRTKATKAAEDLARAQEIEIIQSEIIYDLVKNVEERLKVGMAKKALGVLEVLAVFGKKGDKRIIGGKVIEGEIRNNAALEISRNDATIGKGRIVNLQSMKRDVPKVEVGNECGMLFGSDVEVKVGDKLVMR